MPFYKPDQEEQFSINESTRLVDILRSSSFRTWLGSMFCSIYQDGCEDILDYDDLLQPSLNYFVLIRDADRCEQTSYDISHQNYFATLNCNSVRINLVNSDKLAGKIQCTYASKFGWGFNMKTINNVAYTIWTAPENNNRMTVYRTPEGEEIDNSSYVSYDTNFKLDELINAILEDIKN